ncbi:MAG: flagellar basal body P-ring protein FlgI [Deltaproteobacteria bacterium]|nr:flagellar basal body P-ring protein FlgI [Deltaproteobacteria bacterium]
MTAKTRLIATVLLALALPAELHAARVKDIAQVKGVRENLLIGYGLVIGLKGTGDSGTDITSKSMVRLFEKMGIQSGATDFKSKNVAAVIVTGKLPPFARAGTRMDITVSSIGDAGSLEGGTLLVTPLRAGDQNVYAVAQGPVSLGQLTGGGGGGGGATSFPTTARVPNGALIEKEVDGSFTQKKTFVLSLNNPDFTTAARLSRMINTELGGKYAMARDSGTVDIIVPFNYEGNGVELIATIENLQINPDSKARVILNERTGTIVIGENVRIDNVAISHGDLAIEVSGPKGPKEKVGIINGSTIKDVVKALNTLGVTPKDLTAIFQALRASGALQADLEVL